MAVAACLRKRLRQAPAPRRGNSRILVSASPFLYNLFRRKPRPNALDFLCSGSGERTVCSGLRVCHAEIIYLCPKIAAHGVRPTNGHIDRTESQRAASPMRRPIPHAREGSPRFSRPSQPRCPMGYLCPRMLLACSQGLSPLENSQQQPPILAAEIRSEQRERQTKEA